MQWVKNLTAAAQVTVRPRRTVAQSSALKDLVLPQLRCRCRLQVAAVSWSQSLAWEIPYAASAAIKNIIKYSYY